MEIINSTKKKKIERRVVTIVSQKEINNWVKYFSIHGRKTAFELKSNIPRQSLNNILTSKKGLERVVNKIRKYYKENSTEKQAA